MLYCDCTRKRYGNGYRIRIQEAIQYKEKGGENMKASTLYRKSANRERDLQLAKGLIDRECRKMGYTMCTPTNDNCPSVADNPKLEPTPESEEKP